MTKITEEELRVQLGRLMIARRMFNSPPRYEDGAIVIRENYFYGSLEQLYAQVTDLLEACPFVDDDPHLFKHPAWDPDWYEYQNPVRGLFQDVYVGEVFCLAGFALVKLNDNTVRQVLPSMEPPPRQGLPPDCPVTRRSF